MSAVIINTIIFSGLISHAQAATCDSPRYDETVQLKSISDGDTLRLVDGRKLRLIGINTPELQREQQVAEPFANQARGYLSKLIPPNTNIHLRYGVDKKDHYGRLLAHVFTTKGQNITEVLLEAGLGSSIQITPNLWSYDCYLAAEKRAQLAKRGIWSHPYFQPLAIENLTQDIHGFRFVKGRITRIGKSKHAVWLNMGRNFALRIHKSDLPYFKQMEFEQLRDQTVVVRGWIYKVKKQQRMNLHHPAALQMLPAISGESYTR